MSLDNEGEQPPSEDQERSEPELLDTFARNLNFAGPMGDYPGLSHLFGAYLNWPSMYDVGSWRELVRTFKAEDPEGVPEVRADLRALMDARLPEDELEAVLHALGCGVNRDMGRGSWSAWLGRLDGELAK